MRTPATLFVPGSLQGVKAIGWYIEEYGICQVSMNLTDLAATPLHVAFEEVRSARGRVGCARRVGDRDGAAAGAARGRRVLPAQATAVAGIPTSEVLKIAVRSLGLDELAPFDLQHRVIEAAIAGEAKLRFVDKTVAAFADSVASESPTPGGGTVAAVVGALAAALGTMVANGLAHKRGWDARWRSSRSGPCAGGRSLRELEGLADADSGAFDALMAAFGLPKGDRGGARRSARLRSRRRPRGSGGATADDARRSRASMDVLRAMAETGNPNAASDAGVGGALWCTRGGPWGLSQCADQCGRVAGWGLCRARAGRGRGTAARAEALEAEVLARAKEVFAGRR